MKINTVDTSSFRLHTNSTYHEKNIESTDRTCNNVTSKKSVTLDLYLSKPLTLLIHHTNHSSILFAVHLTNYEHYGNIPQFTSIVIIYLHKPRKNWSKTRPCNAFAVGSCSLRRAWRRDL
jgi:hypothetical protein